MPRRSGPLRRALLPALALLLALGFAALSVWQWQRLGWKQALIARVERQQAGAAQPAPPPPQWPAVARDSDEYRRVVVRGRFDARREILVLASTALGRGHWVLTPLRTDDGWWLWVNRGFVDDAHRDPSTRPLPAGEQQLSGRLRLSEPHGLLWMRNEPASGRWVSRDVAALSAAAGLGAAAPYFVDADAVGDAGAFPRGGLTVLAFSNHHAVYALTWLALALGAVAAAVWLWREGGGSRSAAMASAGDAAGAQRLA